MQKAHISSPQLEMACCSTSCMLYALKDVVLESFENVQFWFTAEILLPLQCCQKYQKDLGSTVWNWNKGKSIWNKWIMLWNWYLFMVH